MTISSVQDENPLYANNCPFCNKTVVQNAFIKSDNFCAIYNVAPILRGHSLVIPFKHQVSLMELPGAEIAEFFQFARQVTELLLEAFKGEGFDWSIQEGNSAGQSVPHLHLHIVIRKPKDLKEDIHWYGKIKENENTLLDSSSRSRLSDEEYLFYSDYLRNEWERMTRRKSDKKK